MTVRRQEAPTFRETVRKSDTANALIDATAGEGPDILAEI